MYILSLSIFWKSYLPIECEHIYAFRRSSALSLTVLNQLMSRVKRNFIFWKWAFVQGSHRISLSVNFLYHGLKSHWTLITKYLKWWSELATPADSSRFYLPYSKGGLKLPSVPGLYQKLQVWKAALLMTSRDGGVQHCEKTVGEKGCCTKSEVQVPVICAASFLPRCSGLMKVPYHSCKKKDDGG